MHTINKLIAFVAIMLLSISSTYAGEINATTHHDYNTPITDSSMNFKAENNNGKISMSWNAYNGSHGDFKWYKIVRSEKNATPVYPDDSYIKYYDNINSTEYSKMTWKQLDAYYRVCAITHSMNRVCSNVVKIQEGVEAKETGDYCMQVIQPAYNPETSECKEFSTPCKVPYGWKKIQSCKGYGVTDSKPPVKYYGISYNLKKKVNVILDKFLKKIEAKYETNAEREAAIDKVIAKLEALAEKKEKLKNLVGYMVEYLNKKKENYDSSLDDIEDIFSDI